MRTSGKLLLAGLTAAVALGAAVGVASARRLEFNNQGIRAVWTAFRLEDLSLLRTVCPVTIEGTLHSRTLSKVSGQLIGFITRARTRKEGCGTEGESLWLSPEDGAAVNTLPWHLRYDSFTGVLPLIETIRLQVIGLGVKIFGTTCEFKSSAERPAFLRAILAAGTITAVQWVETARIPRINGFCGAEGILAGTGSMTNLGGTSAIVVRLVQ
jgi:hypothetical protein